MAEGLNKAILVGNLGADPELKFTNSGQGILRLRLATTESYLDKQSNERKERTEWHTVTVWGKRAEALSKILSKGRTVWVEGRIQTRSWEAQDGSKRYSTEINASNLGLVGGRNGGGGGGGGGGSRQQHEPDYGHGPGDGGGFGDDDIPF